MKIVVSTSNLDKLKEIEAILGSEHELITKAQAGYADFDVVEDKDTLEGNALLKAQALYELTGEAVFGDDTGLFVEALDGAPGVYSARFAGEHCSYQDNVDKMLKELEPYKNIEDRKAYFETVICFIEKSGVIHYVNGRVYGHISFEEKGKNGFGYDPIFVPDGYQESFAQLGIDIKNDISHRAKALNNFKKLLEELE